jgi:16S rRNA (guanine527-N7)-methyltransferase
MPTPIEQFRQALKRHEGDFRVALSEPDLDRLSNYFALVLKWNPRLHLVAPCTPQEFATRHVLESLMLLKHLTLAANLIDVGSGAGLPVIPCLIVRAGLRATLIESAAKKIVFLREAVREIEEPERASLLCARFEELEAPPAGFVTCRALDRFQELLPRLIAWAPPGSRLLLFVGAELRHQIETLIPGARAEPVPHSERRFLISANWPVEQIG